MGIQTISAYPGLSPIADVAQRQASFRAAATPNASAASVADKVMISRAARDLAAQENERISAHSDVPDSQKRFPPASAPTGVHTAWSAVTGEMSDLDRLAAEGAFMAEEISANLRYDSTGRAVGVRQHGEPGYVDLWNQPGVSYPENIDRMLEKLERNQSAYSPKDYTFFHGVLNNFRSAL